MFRIRKSYFGGNCILQVREDGRWVDADSRPELETGFRIVTDHYLSMLQDDRAQAQRELAAIKATRSEAARKGNATRKAKKLPVLTDEISRAEQAAVDMAVALATCGNQSVYTRPR